MDTDTAKQPASASRLAGKRVLIAEDSHAQQRILSFLLGNAGMTTTLVDNGQEAIDRATREPFDAILLDMQMPQVDGYEAAARLRRQGYRGPILALTADTLGGDEQRCLQAGCDGYLAKPVQPAELLGLLMRLLAACDTAVATPTTADEVSFQDLLREYVGGLSERMQTVRASLAAEDRSTLAHLAHKMRGAAAMYGFAELAETAGLLEDAIRENQERTLLHELVDEMDAIVHDIAVRP
jgi:CheY-like chemotaxis protein/HPt (histidine-containing phosphotransfer) domain-containing protein